MLAGGLDGCRNGWVLASSRPDGTALTVEWVPRITAALERDVVLAVDMPIGLPDTGPRACDREARRLVGPRRSSVFPAPSRSTLAAVEPGRLPRQVFNLLPKIREVDAAVTPERQARVVEAHPEACLAAMAGSPMRFPKRTAEGRAERLAALHASFPGADLTELRVPGAKPDDVLDAVAVLWTARRVLRGEDVRLGDGAVDARGLRMEIVV